MRVLVGMTNRTRLALCLSVFWGAGTGCGVVYTPQEFSPSSFTYGYKGDFDGVIQVIPMTFTAARLANADGYTPRSLPGSFGGADPALQDPGSDLLSSGDIGPVEPLQFPAPAPVGDVYDGSTLVVPPVFRNDNLRPVELREPLYLPLPTYAPGGTSALPDAGTLPSSGTYVAGSFTARMPGITTGRAGRFGRQRATGFDSDADLSTLLERPRVREQAAYRPLPDIDPGAYRIGPGDTLALQVRPQISAALGSGGGEQQINQQFLVQDDGRIFVPRVDRPITVSGLTIGEAREEINARLVESGLGFDSGVQIVRFGSKNITVNGLNGAQLIPITLRPTTLGEALVTVGGLGQRPAETIVRVLRDGKIYEMSGDRILGPDQLARRILIDGDIVSVSVGYDPERALAYFDQQMRLREVDRADYESERFLAQERRLEEQERRAIEQSDLNRARFEAEEQRFSAQENRTAEQMALDRIRFELELRTQRLNTDRIRREAEIERLRAQRETDRANEEARIANIEIRQAYLDRLRALETLNRESLRVARQEAREILTANQAELVRARADRLRLLELRLQQEQASMDRRIGARQQERDLFNERMTLGAVEQDHITIAGETKVQTTLPLPFDTQLTLNRVLYGKAGGIDLVSGDSSEIYVIRIPSEDRIQNTVTAYHLDASNPAALLVASVFEMRPNDVVYVNSQPITKWNRVLTQILPSTGLLNSGISAAGGIN